MVLVGLVLATALAACSSGSNGSPADGAGSSTGTGGGTTGTFPVTIHAANGAVKISARPTTIVSLSATATEMLYAIGAGSQVKAVDKDSDYPVQAPRTDLDEVSPNVEAIVSYHPDLVIEAGDSSGLAGQLAPFDIPVLSDPAANTLGDAYSQFEELGTATGHEAQATAEVTHIKAQIASILRTTPKPPPPATYYYELDQTYYSVTSSTFIGKLLGLLGLKNIADDATGAASSGGYPQLSAEFIIRANPEYVILADTICCDQSPATIGARPGWSTMSAVRDGHVIALNDDIASRWGPRIVDLLQTVSESLRSKSAPSP